MSGGLIQHLREPLFDAFSDERQRVRLCSPFIGGGVAVDLAKIARRQADIEWRVLTALSPRAVAHGALNIDGLRRLLRAGVQIRHLDGLHAKVFLIGNQGFVGSANLTSAGLGTGLRPNLELTVTLDSEQLRHARSQFDVWWTGATVVTRSCLKACESAAFHVRVGLEGESPAGSQDLHREAEELLKQSEQVGCWVKAEYRDAESADLPRTEQPWMASPEGNGVPAFREGDLILLYANGTRRCNVVAEVTGPTVRDDAFQLANGISAEDVARWPWVTRLHPRLQVPSHQGVPLVELGINGQSLQSGHRRMPAGGMVTALRYMCGIPDEH